MRNVIGLVMMLALPALAGRPVYKDHSIADLTKRSDAILIVEKTGEAGDASKCEPLRWKLVVREKLKALHDLEAKLAPGNDVEVVTNEFGLIDCEARKKNGSGVSYAAERYIPADREANVGKKPFLVFLKLDPNGLYLTATDAYDSVAQRAKVGKLLGK